MAKEYIYAVSRIKAKEVALLTKTDIDRLLSEKTYDGCIRFLHEKGWGTDIQSTDAAEIIAGEEKKLWSLMDELVDDKNAFDVFKIPNDYHNLKVAIKAITRGTAPENMYIYNGTVAPEFIFECVDKRNYKDLPHNMAETAATAMSTILQTSDGQLCDIIIDSASLRALKNLGEKNENEMIRLYCEISVASANIKTAFRCNKVGKNREFLENAIVECSTLDKESLVNAALKSTDEIGAYLEYTDYSQASAALRNSPSSFEKWCDDYVTEKMQSQKSEYFTIGPLVAFIWARQCEFKIVSLILSLKLNGLDDNIIKERMRELYV